MTRAKKSNDTTPATKADFTSLKTDVGNIKTDIRSLKSDIKEIKNALVGFIHFAKTTFVTKADLERKLDRTKEEITEEMKTHFTAAIEIIESDFKGAHKDEIKTLTDYKENHEERIVVLEKRTGVQL